MRSSFLILLVASIGSACRNIEPAPDDLDGLVHFTWDQLEEGSDATLVGAVEKLHEVVEGDTLEDIVEGVVTSLTADQVAGLRTDRDPAEATGVLLVDRVGCTPAELDEVLTFEDQDAVYDGIFDTYDRTTTSSLPDFLSGDTDRATWDVEYRSSLVGSAFGVQYAGLIRRVSGLTAGPVVVLRTHLLEDAVFDDANTNSFLRQDYQLEVYWPHEGEMLHLYAMWKDTRFLGFEDEAESTQRIILNNLADWDENTTRACRDDLTSD